jgi:phage tail P2-like protein
MPDTLETISLAALVPTSIKDDPQIKAAIAALDAELREVSSLSKTPSLFYRLDQLDHGPLDHLAWQMGVDTWHGGLSLPDKRNLIRRAIALHRKKGTPWAVRQALIWCGFGSAEIREHSQVVAAWLAAGGARLDADQGIDGSTNLAAPSGEFQFTTRHWAEFIVRANIGDVELVRSEQDMARRLINAVKPARSHLVGLDFFAAYWLAASVALSHWAATVRAVFADCAAAQVPRFKLIGAGCQPLGGSYVESRLSGQPPLSGWQKLDGLQPAGELLDQGHWGHMACRLQLPAYTQTAGNAAAAQNILEPNHRFLLTPLNSHRDLSVTALTGTSTLSGRRELSLRPLTRRTYDMLDGSAHLGVLPGAESVWHTGHVDFWHGNQHFREAI